MRIPTQADTDWIYLCIADQFEPETRYGGFALRFHMEELHKPACVLKMGSVDAMTASTREMLGRMSGTNAAPSLCEPSRAQA